ncbi:hypothetical protein FHJ31_21600 [Pseudomonas sp. Fig-3]|nr:hypothetical protein FHJ31_21600 [Pseudomonas sp. Fig-3]
MLNVPPSSRAGSLPQGVVLTHPSRPTQIQCGSEPARDSGLSGCAAQPFNAASMAAMSIFVISIMASNARLAAA